MISANRASKALRRPARGFRTYMATFIPWSSALCKQHFDLRKWSISTLTGVCWMGEALRGTVLLLAERGFVTPRGHPQSARSFILLGISCSITGEGSGEGESRFAAIGTRSIGVKSTPYLGMSNERGLCLQPSYWDFCPYPGPLARNSWIESRTLR